MVIDLLRCAKTLRSRFRATVAMSVCVIFTAVAPAADLRLISIDDLYRLDAPQTPVVLADSAGVIYTRRWSDRATRTVRFSLWRVDGDGKRKGPVEEGEPDGRNPVLSPDGKWIVFQSTRPFPDGTAAVAPAPLYSDTATDLWVMPAAGGKAIPLAGAKKPYGRVFSDPFYGNVSFSPDGKRLVFVADDGRDVRTPEEIRHNVKVVREDHGEGYETYRPAQIWIADLQDSPVAVAALRVVRVTSDDYWYGDPQWMPDGKSLIVHANRNSQREAVRYSINQNFDLWRIDLADNSLKQLTTGPGPDFSPRISADGRQLLYLSVPRRGSHMDTFNLTVNDLVSTGAAPFVIFDQHGPDAGQKAAHLPPSFPLPRDCWLSRDKVYFNVADRTVNRTEAVNLREGPAALGDRLPEAHNAKVAKEVELKNKLLPPERRAAPRLGGVLERARGGSRRSRDVEKSRWSRDRGNPDSPHAAGQQAPVQDGGLSARRTAWPIGSRFRPDGTSSGGQWLCRLSTELSGQFGVRPAIYRQGPLRSGWS